MEMQFLIKALRINGCRPGTTLGISPSQISSREMKALLASGYCGNIRLDATFLLQRTHSCRSDCACAAGKLKGMPLIILPLGPEKYLIHLFIAFDLIPTLHAVWE